MVYVSAAAACRQQHIFIFDRLSARQIPQPVVILQTPAGRLVHAGSGRLVHARLAALFAVGAIFYIFCRQHLQ
jgi:hypothetical protein